ncbi:MAG: sigma-70 family RNA polymerase sigma factor [Myxococcaceae bacterium]|nr:sigma-70 family RNA polymerase sigma factor [Myxococcaceae bacterium]MCI0673416.1 sigma-70 family RNA polymerase sigma factor [Myxococcaceae bacterium]
MADLDLTARFLAALEPHRRLLSKVVRVYGRSEADREDLTQEVIAQLWRAFPRYEPRWAFSTWMYRVALNVAISHQRRERTRSAVVTPADEGALQVPGARDVGIPDEVALLYRAISQLDDLNKALALLYLDGHSQAEMAEILGLTPTNVGTRVGRMKERLRQAVASAEQEVA